MLQRSLLVIFTLCSFTATLAQTEKQRQAVFKDSLDGAFDFSDFLMELNGFVPVPYIITEPAVGGFGGALGLVFIRKQPPLIDTVRSNVKIIPTRPTVSGVAVAYTLNDTWLVGAARSGTWRKFRTRYRIIGAYASLNLSFYRTPKGGEEHEYEFNIKTVPLSGYLMKQFKGTVWSAGLQYLFLSSQVKTKSGNFPDFIDDKEVDSNASMPGVVVEFAGTGKAYDTWSDFNDTDFVSSGGAGLRFIGQKIQTENGRRCCTRT